MKELSSLVSTVFRHMAGSGAKGAGKPQVSSDMTGQGKARAARICYVDDSRTSAYVVKRILRPYGYIVDHFESAEPALIAIIESDYDLLLTDLKVSPTGMDGDDLVRALRASGHKQVASMPVIVITGATDTNILSQVYEAGANQIVTKPVNGEELDAHIRKLVYESKHADDDEFAELEAEAAQSGLHADTSAKVVLFGGDSKKEGVADVVMPESKASSETPKTQAPEAEPLLTDDGRPIPRPAGRVKPAPRVSPIIQKPTIDQKTAPMSSKPVPSGKAKVSPAQVEAARKAKELAAKKMRAAAQLAQKTPVQSQAKKVVDQEALAKVKAAAAAKRAKLIEQQKAKIAAQAKLKQQHERAQRERAERAKAARVAQDRRSQVQATLEPEIPLTLEPKENEPVDVFNRSQPNINQPFGSQNMSGGPAVGGHPGINRPQPTPKAPLHGGASQGGQARSSRAPENKIESPFANDPFAAAAKTATENFGGTHASHTADLFGKSSNSNILKQMDQYPLVQSDYRDNVGSSGVMSMFSSIIELWGPKKVIMAVVLVACLAFFYNNWSGLFSSGVPVQTTLVEQGEIFQSITVPGKVVSKLRVDVTPSIAGRLTNVYVEEGDNVKKGELLARLDDREARSNLKRAEAALGNAEEDVALAERSLKRLRQAFSKGAVAKQLVEEAEVELRSARARQSVAEEEVRTSKLSLENPRIVAPFSGTITARYVEVGQWVVPSETLFSLVDQSQREVEVRVDAADSGGIAVGQTVTLSSDAFPGLQWNESVTRLAAATSNVGNANTVSVYISLGSKAPSLRFGQQVDSEIRTSWNPSALKVPYGAIITKGGKSYVAVVENNVINLVEVETGIEDFTHVEIRQGVHVGQYVILANGADIEEGDRVVLSNN